MSSNKSRQLRLFDTFDQDAYFRGLRLANRDRDPIKEPTLQEMEDRQESLEKAGFNATQATLLTGPGIYPKNSLYPIENPRKKTPRRPTSRQRMIGEKQPLPSFKAEWPDNQIESAEAQAAIQGLKDLYKDRHPDDDIDGHLIDALD